MFARDSLRSLLASLDRFSPDAVMLRFEFVRLKLSFWLRLEKYELVFFLEVLDCLVFSNCRLGSKSSSKLVSRAYLSLANTSRILFRS